jgi:hypothetical protein
MRKANMQNSRERVFSIELRSRKNLKNVTLTNGSRDAVLVEGVLGELVEAAFKEGVILEVIGKNGILRIDLAENEISKSPEQENREANNPD